MMKYLLPILILFSGCGIKQIRETGETTHANTDRILEQQQQILANQERQNSVRDSLIAVLIERIDSQESQIRGLKASSGNRFDNIEQQFSRLGSRIQESTGKFSDVAFGVEQVRRKVLADSAKTDTTGARAAFDAAENDMIRGHYELAIAGYNTFLERWATSPLAINAYFGRGKAKLTMNDTTGAVADFRAACAVTPTNERSSTAFWQLGRLLRATNQIEDAKDIFMRLVAQFPDTPEAQRATEQLMEIKKLEKKTRRR